MLKLELKQEVNISRETLIEILRCHPDINDANTLAREITITLDMALNRSISTTLERFNHGVKPITQGEAEEMLNNIFSNMNQGRILEIKRDGNTGKVTEN